MYCYIETIVKGEAARQVKKVGVKAMATMRDFLFRRFGAGQPEILEERVRNYHLGMPDPKSGEAFPPRCDIDAKLDALEAEREYLIEMCPKDPALLPTCNIEYLIGKGVFLRGGERREEETSSSPVEERKTNEERNRCDGCKKPKIKHKEREDRNI
jgi:hypothetical protein